ncbi:MAG TPA: carboxypeptidase-like regulatory domain-containing protein, partial [Bryobacterales bacterium]|nr:carboxypeptidase-like regulatory domain-containing protein [Bryobacterales bacterium]
VNATLLGTITDASGGAVPNAKVTITETNTSVSRSTATNESGNYVFSNLPPGTYAVVAEMAGFKRAEQKNVSVLVNTTGRVDLVLQPGEVTEIVNVTAETPALQTETADTGRKIETVQVENMPLAFNRNFQGLLALVPGADLPFRPHSEFFNPQASLSVQVNGQSRLANNLQLEGVDDNERTGLLQVLIPPIEAIQTVDVTTSNYDAELGRATGAVTNVILKSGTNDIHGSAYEFNRVSALSARVWQNPTRDHFVFNYVGGTIGGPIIKNRTFFFGDFLRVMDHRYSVDRYTLPTPDERAGDLSAAPSVIYDPATGAADGTGRQPFSNKTIPASRIDPLSLKILSLVPAANVVGANGHVLTTNNYFEPIPFVRDTSQFDVKIDHNQTDKDRFSGRFSFERPVTTDQSSFGDAGGPHGGGFEAVGSQNTYSAAINYDHIFSPTLLTEARVGVNRYRNEANQIDYGKNDAQTLGVPGVNISAFTSGQVGVQLNSSNNAPFSNPLIGYSASLPWIRSETNINFVNTWTKTAGNHTIKWGVDLRRIRDDLLQDQTFSPRGLYTFGTAQTSILGAPTSFGNNVASFLLDVPSSVGRDVNGIFPAYRAWEFFSFVGDKWLATPKLTLDIGVRWEFYPPATPAHSGGFSQYDPYTNSLIIAGIGNNPSNLGLQVHYHDFAPRFGAAYRLNEKTVFRGGFGISYTSFPDNSYAYNFPVRQNNAYEPNCSVCPTVLPNGQTATFAIGFPPATLAVYPSNGIIPNADLAQVYDYINPHFREPYVESWNLTVQRTLPQQLVLEVAYVGNHGVAQPANYNLNASSTLGADINGQPLYQLFGKKASVNYRYQGFSSSYNALQVKVDRRFSGGFAMTTAYTYSKAMGYQSEDGGLDFYINPHRNWHVLDFNRTQNFVQSYVYQLPFGQGKHWMQSGPAASILGGWQLNGVLTLATGRPINFGGNSSVLKAPGNSNRLNHDGPIKILHGTGPGNPWFDATQCSTTVTTDCFSQPGALQFGNLGWNPINGPGYWNLDASLFRTFKIRERFSLELRGEALSLMNTPQWSPPDTGIGNSTFGQVTAAGLSIGGNTATAGNRIMQLGARVTF